MKNFFTLFVLMASALAALGQSIDYDFRPVLSKSSQVYCSAKSSAGQIYIGGSFTEVNGITHKYIARLNADGTVDNSFSPELFGRVYAIAVQGDDDKVIVSGEGYVVRLNYNGSLDSSFDLSDSVHDSRFQGLALQSDNKIVAAGMFDDATGAFQSTVVRFNEDGSLDNTFNLSVENSLSEWNSRSRWQIKIQNDNKLLVCGLIAYTNSGGTETRYMTRLNSDGSVDDSFLIGTGADDNVNDIEILTDGSILIGGEFSTFNGTSVNGVIKLSESGTLDASFNPTHLSQAYTLYVNSDGTFLSGGVGTVMTLTDAAGAKISDLNFNTSGSFYGIEKFSTGDFLFYGDLVSYNDTPSFSSVVVNADGSLDATAHIYCTVAGIVHDIGFQSTGKVIVAGDFSLIDDTIVGNIVRLNSDGSIDNAFNTGTGLNSKILDVNIDHGDKIVVSGEFNRYNSESVSRLTRLNADGTLDYTFENLSIWPSISLTELNNNGEIMIAGRFKYIGGNRDYKYFALLDNTGNVSSNFVNDNISSQIDFISPYGSDSYLIGGGQSNGEKGFLGKIDAEGRLDINYIPEVSHNNSFTGAVHRNDTTIITSENSLLALDNSGNRISGFKNIPYGSIYDIASVPNGYVLAQDYNSSTFYTQSGFLGFYDLQGNLISEIIPTESGGFSNLIIQGNYLYAMGNVNAVGDSSFYGLVRLDISAIIGAPSALSAGLNTEEELSIDLSWEYNSIDESGFAVYRDNGDDIFHLIGYSPIDQELFTDNSVNGNTTYRYKVKALGLNNTSSFSNIAEITTPEASLSTPSPLSFKDIGPQSVTLNWIESSRNDIFYEIYLSTNANTGFELIGTTYSNNFYNAENLRPGTTYYFKYRLTTGGQRSDFSSVASITTEAVPFQPPTELLFTVDGFNQITLNWTDNAEGEEGYFVYRSASVIERGGSTFSSYNNEILLATLPANSTSFIDPDVNTDITYTYHVKAFNSEYISKRSNYVSATTENYFDGAWVQQTDFTGPERSGAVAFSIGGKAYVGLGRNGTGALQDFYEYDPSGDNWQPKSDFPGTARTAAVSFNIGKYGYVGLGNDFINGNSFERDFYKYDPATDQWVSIADFPEDPTSGAGVSSAVAFVIDSIAYVGLGNNGTNNPVYFYAYYPNRDEWVSIADFPGEGRPGAVAFSLKGYGYVGLGGVLSTKEDFYKYDPETNEWSKWEGYSRVSFGMSGAVGLSPVNEGWVGTGDAGGFIEDPTNESYLYLDVLDVWYKNNAISFSGAARTSATGFMISDDMYILTGSASGTYMTDVWKYSPAFAAVSSAPTDAYVTFNSYSSLSLHWSDNAANEYGYIIERSLAETGPFTVIDSVSNNTAHYVDTGLAQGTIYYYKVKSFNGNGNSPYSNVTTGFTADAPNAPTTFTLNAVDTERITLNWSDDSDTEFGYAVYRSTDGITFEEIADLAPNSINYQDSILTYNTRYYYYLAAYNITGSTLSDTLSTVTYPDSTVIHTTNSFSTSITLYWSSEQDNLESYNVYRKNASGTFEVIGIVNGQTTAFLDAELAVDSSYQYKVSAVNTSGESLLSSPVTVWTTPANPGPLAISAKSTSSIQIEYTPAVGGLTEYELITSYEIDADSFLDTIPIATEESSYVLENMLANTVYNCYIVASNPTGQTVSTAVDGIALPAAPQQFSATTQSSHSVMISILDSVAHVNDYNIYRSEDGINYNLVYTLSSRPLEVIDDDLTPDSRYAYYATAVNFAGESESGIIMDVQTAPLAPVFTLSTISSTEIEAQIDRGSEFTAIDIYYKRSDEEAYAVIKTLQNQNIVSIDNLTADNEYNFYVMAINEGGYAASDTLTQFTLTNAVELSGAAEDIGNSLAWSDVNKTEVNYLVERAVDGEAYSILATLSGGVEEYFDKDVKHGRSYKYRVITEGPSGNSDYSNTIEIVAVVTSIDRENYNFLVHPNPVRNSLKVVAPQINQIEEIAITDLLGHKANVSIIEVPGGYVIDMVNLKAGWYNLTIRLSSGELINSKIVKAN